jgi:uncharacterized membrane protein HdeD (DUF308 family)
MPTLDDFLDPLFSGTREVEVPKSQVSEPLDLDWKLSKINIPSPKMISSYRKGRLHVHVYEDEFRVHLDKYDPDKHPALHLIDDAPLILMIWGTLGALSLEAGDTAKGREDKRIAALKGTYWTRIVIGALVATGGVMLMLSPLQSAKVASSVVVPMLVVGIGLLILYRALRQSKRRSWTMAAIGLAIVVIGIAMFYFSQFSAVLVLLVLAVWFLGSAALSIRSALRKTSVSEGGAAPKLVMGLLSLILGVLIFFMPGLVVTLLFFLFGAIGLLAGILLIASGLALRRISNEMSSRSTAKEAN